MISSSDHKYIVNGWSNHSFSSFVVVVPVITITMMLMMMIVIQDNNHSVHYPNEQLSLHFNSSLSLCYIILVSSHYAMLEKVGNSRRNFDYCSM